MKQYLLSAMLLMLAAGMCAADRLVGGDLSLVPAYEQAGDKWLDASGQVIPDLITYVRDQGWNVVRVRLFVDPTQDKSDPAVCQDYAYVRQLGTRVRDAGMQFMLDFHYSDTWADPSQQRIPAAWRSNTKPAALAQQLYDYTYDVIGRLVQDGATPHLVQIGNEITYGLLWNTTDGRYPTASNQYASAGYCPTWSSSYSAGASQWRRTASLLNNAAHAVHQSLQDHGVDSTQVRLIVHTELGSGVRNQDYFYRHIRQAGFDNYDIIGLSYYPFWHGRLETLGSLLATFHQDFPDREIQIVETAWYNNYYPYTSNGTNEYAIASLNPRWTANGSGQVHYLQDLVAYLRPYDYVTGLVYWCPEECGNGYSSAHRVMNSWLNRGLWQNSSSQRHSILRETGSVTGVQALAAFAAETDAVAPIVQAASCHTPGYFDLQGRQVSAPHHGVYICDGRKVQF